MPGEANTRQRERSDETGRSFVSPFVCFPARRLFHFVSCLSSFAVLLLCGCAGLQDARSERLPPTSVEQMRAHRVQPEIVGFGTMKAGANTISFMAHSWVDGAETTTLPMTDAMSRGDTHAMVDAVLNDGVRVPMLVDTGAASDVLSPSLVEKLKLPLFDTGNETATVRGVGGEQAVFPAGCRSCGLAASKSTTPSWWC